MTTEVTERPARSIDVSAQHEATKPRRAVWLRLASAAEVLASFELYVDDMATTLSGDMDSVAQANIAMARFTIDFMAHFPPREEVYAGMSGAKKIDFVVGTVLNANRFSSAISGVSELDPGDGDATALVESWRAHVFEPRRGRRTITVPVLEDLSAFEGVAEANLVSVL